MSGPRMQPLPRTAQLRWVSTSILLQICLPLLPPAPVPEVKRDEAESPESFFHPEGPQHQHQHFKRSSCCEPGCRNRSRTRALRQIQRIQPTIIYFEAAASSISALSESNQSNSKLYPEKWASGIDSKGQWLPAIIESKWQRVQLFSFCSILTNDPVLMEAMQGQW